jgi:antitoxin component YwqK of YwqJK toxin-antitoxin module
VNGLYRNSKQSGVWTYYKEDGTTVDRTVTYRNGVLVADPVHQPKPKPKTPVKRR